MLDSMLDSIVRKIFTSPVYDVARETSLDKLKVISESLGNSIFLKREDQQGVFSFKLRGAYQKIMALSEDERQRGVVAASAGNHAQGVALAASKLGIKATIVMPKPTATIKMDNVRRLGGNVVVYGDNFDEACAYALDLAREKGLSFIHPYDDPDVIAGQGTIALEILRQRSGKIDGVFVPVGGGGLISGVAACLKFFRPDIKVVAVEPDGCACCAAALKSGRREILPSVDLFAEGVAVKQLGELTHSVIRKTVDACITVSNDEIAAAIKDIFVDTRAIAEPSGAVGLAGIKKYIRENGCKEGNFVTILSGANMNFERLKGIAQMCATENEILFSARLKEEPGSFRAFCNALPGCEVTEFNYRLSHLEKANVFVGIRLKGGQTKDSIFKDLNEKGYAVMDMTDNVLAKTHVRYMVGGAPKVPCHETIYSFEFPERMGALSKFLDTLGQRWSITMFHYCNQGASIGRVFLGLSIPDEEKAQLPEFLKKLGYKWVCEDGNPAYEYFLK